MRHILAGMGSYRNFGLAYRDDVFGDFVLFDMVGMFASALDHVAGIDDEPLSGYLMRLTGPSCPKRSGLPLVNSLVASAKSPLLK